MRIKLLSEKITHTAKGHPVVRHTFLSHWFKIDFVKASRDPNLKKALIYARIWTSGEGKRYLSDEGFASREKALHKATTSGLIVSPEAEKLAVRFVEFGLAKWV